MGRSLSCIANQGPDWIIYSTLDFDPNLSFRRRAAMAVSRATVVADTASREAMAIAAMEDKEPMEVSREAMVVDKVLFVLTKTLYHSF